MVLLGNTVRGAVYDTVGGMAERMERRAAVLWWNIAGGMGGISGCYDSNISRDRR